MSLRRLNTWQWTLTGNYLLPVQDAHMTTSRNMTTMKTNGFGCNKLSGL